ncbi:hypothetical protein BDM02DRAFT_3270053 [Thelephora ganbajun]|uniref:Uncharacterized protein n=1 Tax=Thelephora ganbajun TaxID=370292 RepID=A0ACB6ZDL4_THEGA|nr:hypothetical protein BDM02DRAFT_3270053 [Thelephora ganbajun]
MDILEKSYPDDDHVFINDKSTTHLKRARDMVSERRMPVNALKEEKNWLVPTPNLDESRNQFFGVRSGPSTKTRSFDEISENWCDCHIRIPSYESQTPPPIQASIIVHVANLCDICKRNLKPGGILGESLATESFDMLVRILSLKKATIDPGTVRDREDTGKELLG